MDAIIGMTDSQREAQVGKSIGARDRVKSLYISYSYPHPLHAQTKVLTR